MPVCILLEKVFYFIRIYKVGAGLTQGTALMSLVQLEWDGKIL